MDITVNGSSGLPDKAILSVRVENARKQTPVRSGECFHFEPKGQPRSFTVDVFDRVASKQVKLSDLAPGANGEFASTVEVGGMSLNLSVAFIDAAKQAAMLQSAAAAADKQAQNRIARKDAVNDQCALKAKTYLEGRGISQMLQGLVKGLITEQPDDPVQFMGSYIEQHKGEIKASENQAAVPKQAMVPLSALYGPGFYSCGVRPNFRVC